MKENKYDDDRFFSQYAQMSRSVEGLQGAGEWHILQKCYRTLQTREYWTQAADLAGTVSMPSNMSKVCYRN